MNRSKLGDHGMIPGRSAALRVVSHVLMMTRLWRGWTTRENADAYERFLLSELFPEMRSIPGFRSADVLRRADGNEVAFVTLTRFDSLDAIRAFAGEDYEMAVIEPTARVLLSHYDEQAQHYDTSSFAT
ncbi:MAG: antibiotic biosynthesis monooxygenase family protein [Solirubrobacteraceae bacterium]